MTLTDGTAQSVSVAATGQPYPLKFTGGGTTVVLDRWGQPAQLTAPANTLTSRS